MPNYRWFRDEWMGTKENKKTIDYLDKKLGTPTPRERMRDLLYSAYRTGFHDGWDELSEDHSEITSIFFGEVMMDSYYDGDESEI